MHDGHRILKWVRQNKHTLTWVAQRIGYSRQTLSRALHTNHISPKLADALFEHFSLRVEPTNRTKSKKPGNDAPTVSKLDPYQKEIKRLLAQGSTQRFIASRFGTSESNLSRWMQQRGMGRRT